MAMLAGIEMELEIPITTATTVEMVDPTIPTVAFKQMINVPYQDTMAIHGENAFKNANNPNCCNGQSSGQQQQQGQGQYNLHSSHN